MEARVVYTKQNPKETAKPISQLFFWWTKELFMKGGQRDLELADLYHPLKSDESEKLGDRLEESWKYELQKLNHKEYIANKKGPQRLREKNVIPQLFKAIARTFWANYFGIGFLLFLQHSVLAVFQPSLQGLIINYFKVKSDDTEDITKLDALAYAGYLSVSIFTTVFLMHHASLLSQQMGMKVRVACSSLIYRKILRLSTSALTQTTAGHVVNLLSNDLSRFDDLAFFLHFVWIAPIQLTIVTILMWHRVGVATFIGIGSLLLLVLPIDSYFTHVSRKLRAMIATLTDKRVQLMNELIAGIQVIKMYAWESPFAKIVSSLRVNEMKKIRLSSYVRAMYISMMIFSNRTVLFLTLVSFVMMGNALTADISFVLATYFDVLQLSITVFLPQALIVYGETMVSIQRLEQFLFLDEQIKDENVESQTRASGTLKFKKWKKEKKRSEQCLKIEKLSHNSSNKAEHETPVSITLDRVSANWIPSQLPPTLCNVSCDIKGGQLCALIGAVGSGKSSILHLLLRELPLGAGVLKLYRKSLENDVCNKSGYFMCGSDLKISYATQEAWLFSGTVRDNILFGQPYDRDRYVAVTRACALAKDFQQLPHGDMSNVGESGSSLSGGQRARVNLARAVYRQADIYLFDDPLSAVDARVARHLFHKCIEKYLRGKTRILVTHQLQFVRRADNIIVLDHGFVKMQGSYDDLFNSSQEFVNLINRMKMSNEIKEGENTKITGQKSFRGRRASAKRSVSKVSVTSIASSVVSYNDNADFVDDTEDEVIATGRLSRKVYKDYFLHGGSYSTLFFVVVLFVVSQVATSGTDYWISYWTNLETLRKSIKNDTHEVNVQYSFMFNNTFLSSLFTLDKSGLLRTDSSIYLYTFCILSCITTIIMRNFFFMKICMNASCNLHNAMFSNILPAVMRFFHNNPSGRILNRFSKDVGAMDELLPKVMLDAIQIGLVMSGVFLMVVIVNIWMLIPLVILGTIFYFIRSWYLKTAQNIKRLEGIAKSPVFSHVNATLRGLMTIRSSGVDIQNLLRQQFDRLQDVHTGTWFLTISTTAAFGFLLDIIACCFIVCVCFSFILLDSGNTMGGSVGLAISQSLLIIGTLQYGVKQSAEMVSNMTAVERILQYTNLPKEGPWESDNPPPAAWPTKGGLTLKDVNMKYDKDEPPVLKNLNVMIEPGWKVGVVGRTGAGKSSLISVLFRLFAENQEGQVKIDEKDTSTLGLHELRSRLSIIPQQPFLFSASLRYNLDPFNYYDDMVLWDTLRQVELNNLILDQNVLPSGNNLSIGQRQLICLARAILRNNKILILDEATANIDSDTDALIQQTIRTKFADCTVLTIAHRLNTIIDSDRIIVMDNGHIVEFGCPYELLRDKPDGYFSQMVENTGHAMSQNLREQAEQACLKNIEQRAVDLSLSSTETDATAFITEQSSL